MKDNNNVKSDINVMLQITICILLIAIIILGIVKLTKDNNNDTATNTSNVAQTEETSSINEPNDVTVNIENENNITVVQPENDTTVESSTNYYTNYKVGKTYVADVYEFLSLRSNASTTASVITTVQPYTEMTVLSDSYDPMVYVRIDTGSYVGYTGYVNEDYITQKGYSMIRANNSASYEYYYVYNTKEYLPIRSIAEINDDYEISRLYNGDAVSVIEKTNNKFWLVKDVNSGNVGYVVSSYLTK